MPERKPLNPNAPPDILAAIREELGVDENNNPPPLPGAVGEIEAASRPGLPAEPPSHQESPMFTFPPKVVAVARIVAGAGGIALLALPLLASLPGWVAFAVFAVVAAASFIAGLPLPSPFKGKALLSGSAVATAATFLALLVDLAAGMPPGIAQSGVLLAAALLASAAGLALPQKPAEAKSIILPVLVGMALGGLFYAPSAHAQAIASHDLSASLLADDAATPAQALDLVKVKAWGVEIRCPSGQTVAAGTVRAQILNGLTGSGWARAPWLDREVTSEAAGTRRVYFGDFAHDMMRLRRWVYITNAASGGVSCSGGGTPAVAYFIEAGY